MNWFLRNVPVSEGLESVVRRFRDGVDAVRNRPSHALAPEAEQARRARAIELVASGVPEDLALDLASLSALRGALNAVLIAEQFGLPIANATATLFAISDQFALDRLRASALALPVADYYERMAIDNAVAEIGIANAALPWRRPGTASSRTPSPPGLPPIRPARAPRRRWTTSRAQV